MSINNFTFAEDISTADWLFDARRIFLENVRQACVDNRRSFIAAIPKADPKNFLNIFYESGELNFVFSPHSGYFFEYLSEDVMHGVRAVCSNHGDRGDTLDWYFKIDLYSKELVKQGRA